MTVYVKKYGQDSIYNGADDNASTCVAMQQWQEHTRNNLLKEVFSLFFTEQRNGTLGSNWYSSHTTVPEKLLLQY
jgi:hypothetical protein